MNRCEVDGQRASALRFADVAVQALFSALLVFRLLPRGFSNRDLRDHWAPLMGRTAQAITQGQMTYHVRRLRLHGLMERLPRTHRYRVTQSGWRTALFCTRSYKPPSASWPGTGYSTRSPGRFPAAPSLRSTGRGNRARVRRPEGPRMKLDSCATCFVAQEP